MKGANEGAFLGIYKGERDFPALHNSQSNWNGYPALNVPEGYMEPIVKTLNICQRNGEITFVPTLPGLFDIKKYWLHAIPTRFIINILRHEFPNGELGQFDKYFIGWVRDPKQRFPVVILLRPDQVVCRSEFDLENFVEGTGPYIPHVDLKAK